MTKIKVDQHGEEILRVQVQGHALSAAYGQDLVCAGISSIIIGGLNGLDEMFPNACDLEVDSKANQIRIQVIHSGSEIQSCLRFLLFQLKTIQERYPGSIQIKKKEV